MFRASSHLILWLQMSSWTFHNLRPFLSEKHLQSYHLGQHLNLHCCSFSPFFHVFVLRSIVTFWIHITFIKTQYNLFSELSRTWVTIILRNVWWTELSKHAVNSWRWTNGNKSAGRNHCQKWRRIPSATSSCNHTKAFGAPWYSKKSRVHWWSSSHPTCFLGWWILWWGDAGKNP